ncbi:helix-turn-helix domain-containing protein [Sunxiuqinia indica]|uniref:helix-turn-helix domain-containing protein n=1 Tax=Sunxiuqinia indica TaxID=2692584 RepID=UPI00135890F9|nr:AraC family transcriptional regulator [Sunxiuqinia indica]
MKIGYVVVEDKITPFKLDAVNKQLKKAGLEVIDGHKNQLLNKIKSGIEEYAYMEGRQSNLKLSDFLMKKIDLYYAYISSLFSSDQGITIEKYLIKLKIERAQVMLLCDEKEIAEIAWELGYSSFPHFSGQFKKTTGISPTRFKKIMKQTYNEI